MTVHATAPGNRELNSQGACFKRNNGSNEQSAIKMEGAAVAGAPSMHSSVFIAVKTRVSQDRVEVIRSRPRSYPRVEELLPTLLLGGFLLGGALLLAFSH